MSFYPSSIKASKDLDKTMGAMLPPQLAAKQPEKLEKLDKIEKIDLTMDEGDPDVARIAKFKEMCEQQLAIGTSFEH